MFLATLRPTTRFRCSSFCFPVQPIYCYEWLYFNSVWHWSKMFCSAHLCQLMLILRPGLGTKHRSSSAGCLTNQVNSKTTISSMCLRHANRIFKKFWAFYNHWYMQGKRWPKRPNANKKIMLDFYSMYSATIQCSKASLIALPHLCIDPDPAVLDMNTKIY
jgi:hypothetical protein